MSAGVQEPAQGATTTAAASGRVAAEGAATTARCAKLFVVGCPRSGTTWVRSILSQHPAVVGGAESHLFPVLFDALAADVPAGERRRRVLARFDERAERAPTMGHTGPHRWIDRADLERLLDRCDGAGASGETAARIVLEGVVESFFAANRGTAGAVLAEKTPRHLVFADRILAWWPEARIVEVVRDGRDVCVSLEHKSRVRSWAPSDRTDQIRQWSTAVRRGLHLRSSPAAAGRWHTVRYEDLSADPRSEISRLYRFAGLEADAPSIAAAAEATAFANASRSAESHHVRQGEVGGWREQFSDADREQFAELAGDLLVALGYEC